MKVTIVTPSYNQAEFLEESILSVLEQDYPDIEYIVVDGASRDGSVDIIRRYADRLAYWESEPDDGHADALNKGFARATGDLLAWINSDDTLLPGTVSELVAEFAANPELVLVYGDCLYTDERSNRIGTLRSRPWDPPAMVRHCDNHVPQPASMWTRRGWELAGPFDPEAGYFFDFEFFLRLSALGPAKQVPRPWSTYREHDSSKTSDLRGKARGYVLFGDRFLAGERLPELLRPYARQGRSSARIAAGIDLYGPPLDVRSARRLLWSGLVLYPRNASARTLSVAFKSLLPKPVVRRLRARRDAARRD